ncbi:MAG: CDP-alcohol phosphatidyltransferase family protein [Candidatus Eisenbacteria bacterium]
MCALLSKEGKERLRSLADPITGLLVRARVHPNVLTIAGLVLAVVAGLLLGIGQLRRGAIVFLAGGLFDMLDGAVARAAGKGSRFGAFFDSSIDRYAEIVPYLGLSFFMRSDTLFFLPFLVITGSLMVSYTRARIEGLGGTCHVGLLERPERIVLLFLGLLIGGVPLKIALVLLAVGSHFTAFQRMRHARSIL